MKNIIMRCKIRERGFPVSHLWNRLTVLSMSFAEYDIKQKRAYASAREFCAEAFVFRALRRQIKHYYSKYGLQKIKLYGIISKIYAMRKNNCAQKTESRQMLRVGKAQEPAFKQC